MTGSQDLGGYIAAAAGDAAAFAEGNFIIQGCVAQISGSSFQKISRNRAAAVAGVGHNRHVRRTGDPQVVGNGDPDITAGEFALRVVNRYGSAQILPYVRTIEVFQLDRSQVEEFYLPAGDPAVIAFRNHDLVDDQLLVSARADVQHQTIHFRIHAG